MIAFRDQSRKPAPWRAGFFIECGMKRCSKCGTNKEGKEFYKNKSNPDGLAYQCKECSLEYMRARQMYDPLALKRAQKKYQETHKAELLIKWREYNKTHREIRLEKSRVYEKKHKKERRAYAIKYYKMHKEEIKNKNKLKNRKYYEVHKEEIKNMRMEYYYAHKNEIAEKGKIWREDHAKIIKERKKKYYNIHKHDEVYKKKAKQYREANKNHIVARSVLYKYGLTMKNIPADVFMAKVLQLELLRKVKASKEAKSG